MFGRVRRIPVPLRAVLFSVIAVFLTLALLRLTLNPNEETMVESAQNLRIRREAVVTHTRAPGPAPTAGIATSATGSTPTTAAAAATAVKADTAGQSAPTPPPRLVDEPSIGDTQVATDGLEITLMAVVDVLNIEQWTHHQIPKRDVYRVVTMKFVNNGSDNITVTVQSIYIIGPDGSEYGHDYLGTDALINSKASPTEARALILLETIPVGTEIEVAVTFDLHLTVSDADTVLSIAGMDFVVPRAMMAPGTQDDGSAKPEPTNTGSANPTAVSTGGKDWGTTRADARVVVEEQVAISRTGLATVGDTQVDASGFGAMLVAVTNLPELKQFTGSPFRPKHGTFKMVIVRFTNGTSSALTVARRNIVLISPDGTETMSDNSGTNALTGMVPDAERGRPLYLIESIPVGQTVPLAVVFDVPTEWTGLNIEIEGFLFEVPDPD